MRFGALLFDLDGTLVDSHHEICLALDRALIDAGEHLPFTEVQRLVDGSPLEVIWEKLRGAATAQAAEFTHFAQSYRHHYMQDLGSASALFPGVRETLTQLRSVLPSARFSVVSNKSMPSVQPLLVRFDIQHCFDLALGCGGTSVPPKPHPDLLLQAAKHFGREPESCVMIGDTALDVLAGRRAGMRTIAITHGMASRRELEAAEADHLIDSFTELSALLTG